MSIQPMGDKLLLTPIPVEEKTAGGLFIPDNARTTPDKGIVEDMGDLVAEPKLAKGTTVLFRKNAGDFIRHNDKDYIILPVKEVIGILKDEN